MDLDLKRKLRLFPHIKEKFLSQIKSDSEVFRILYFFAELLVFCQIEYNGL